MMGWSPKCYIPSFVKIGLPVLEKKIFGCFFFLIINGRGGLLGHVTRISRSNFRFPYPWMLHIEFHFDLPSIFREDLSKVCMDDRPADSRAANSAVQGRFWLKFELIQDVMVILVTSKNEEDPIKIEGNTKY